MSEKLAHQCCLADLGARGLSKEYLAEQLTTRRSLSPRVKQKLRYWKAESLPFQVESDPNCIRPGNASFAAMAYLYMTDGVVFKRTSRIGLGNLTTFQSWDYIRGFATISDLARHSGLVSWEQPMIQLASVVVGSEFDIPAFRWLSGLSYIDQDGYEHCRYRWSHVKYYKMLAESGVMEYLCHDANRMQVAPFLRFDTIHVDIATEWDIKQLISYLRLHLYVLPDGFHRLSVNTQERNFMVSCDNIRALFAEWESGTPISYVAEFREMLGISDRTLLPYARPTLG